MLKPKPSPCIFNPRTCHTLDPSLTSCHAVYYTRSSSLASTMNEQWCEPLRWMLNATRPDTNNMARLAAVSRAIKISRPFISFVHCLHYAWRFLYSPRPKCGRRSGCTSASRRNNRLKDKRMSIGRCGTCAFFTWTSAHYDGIWPYLAYK